MEKQVKRVFESGDGIPFVWEIRARKEVTMAEAMISIRKNLSDCGNCGVGVEAPVISVRSRRFLLYFVDERVRWFLQVVYFKVIGVCLLIYFAIS